MKTLESYNKLDKMKHQLVVKKEKWNISYLYLPGHIM